MKRKLFTQITNEWRDNIWMIIELAIVTGAIWILIVLCWGIAKGKFQPKGFDIDDVYAANIEFVTSDSPEFQPPVNSDQYDYYGARKA
ncbi:MAG: ABC transporter permease, partial [Bacteroides sp.]|nr:ABC transporter permease [Bacteroides sp.]